jgi:hypothetical protein
MLNKQIVFASLLMLAVSSRAWAIPIAAPGTEGFSVVVSNTTDVVATYQGNTAGYSNDLYLELTALGPGLDGDPTNDQFLFNNHASPVGSMVNLGSFAIGTELVFRLFVNNTGENFYTGDPSRNPDGLAHARVQANWQPNETLVSFEDLLGLPEGVNGYNDLSFSFTSTRSAPEPVSVALWGTGLALFAVRRRMRKSSH